MRWVKNNLLKFNVSLDGNPSYDYCEAMGSLQQREFRSIEDIKKHQNPLYRVRNKVKHKVSECVGSYFVHGYTREDGTKINGYTRTCGAKHNN